MASLLSNPRRWLAHHRLQLGAAFSRLAKEPSSSMLTITVIAVALALPGGLRVLINNSQAVSGAWENAQDFSVYLDVSVDETGANELAATIAERADVESVSVVLRSDALEEFKRYSGFGDVLENLDENPLPHALVVRPAVDEADSGIAIAQLGEELDSFPEIDLVQLDTAWVERFRAILSISRRAVNLVTVLLGIAVVIVIGNTIRLEINNRKREIEVTKLVGGSDGFIRRPFLYVGLWYGLGGGALAWLLITGGLQFLKGPAAELAGLYGSGLGLRGLGVRDSFVLVFGGGLLGWLGAWLAAGRHLRAIEPD